MSSGGSVTHWIEQIRHGDPAAARALWERYFPRLVRLTREKLRGVPRRVADEEDIALSAMDRFCRAAGQGRFPELAGRDDLWRLLLRIADRRVVDQARHEAAQRRGGGRILGDSALGPAESPSGRRTFAEAADEGPTPEFAATMADECRRLLERLEDGRLQALAMAKMEGYSNKEIAGQVGCSVRTVERRLKLIRDKWTHECDEPSRPT